MSVQLPPLDRKAQFHREQAQRLRQRYPVQTAPWTGDRHRRGRLGSVLFRIAPIGAALVIGLPLWGAILAVLAWR